MEHAGIIAPVDCRGGRFDQPVEKGVLRPPQYEGYGVGSGLGQISGAVVGHIAVLGHRLQYPAAKPLAYVRMPVEHPGYRAYAGVAHMGDVFDGDLLFQKHTSFSAKRLEVWDRRKENLETFPGCYSIPYPLLACKARPAPKKAKRPGQGRCLMG